MIQFGNDKIKDIYVGSDKIKEVYYGSEKVWGGEVEPIQEGYWVHKDTGVKTYFGLDDLSITDGILGWFPWGFDSSEIQLPSGVTGLGNELFMFKPSLASITIPESVTSIGYSCFEMCPSLTLAIVLPAVPPSLGTYAFENVHPAFNIKVRSPYVNDYKTATNWNQYASIISAI